MKMLLNKLPLSASLLPFILLLLLLPYSHTVALRLLLLLICFGISIWRYLKQNRNFNLIEVPGITVLSVWTVICALSVIYSIDTQSSWGEFKNEVIYALIAYFSFFVAAQGKEETRWLLRFAALGFFITGLIAMWRGGLRFIWGDRDAVLVGGFGIYVSFLVIYIPILIWLIFEENKVWLKRIAVVLLIFACYLFFMGQQRGALVAVVFQVSIIIYLGIRYRFVSRRQLALGSAMAVLILTVGSVYVLYVRASGSPMVHAVAQDIRFGFFPSVIEKIIEHPFIGIGFGQHTFKLAYPELIPTNDQALWHAHNLLLNYGLQAGVPGILAISSVFVFMIILFYRCLNRGAKWSAIAGIALVTGVLLRHQFNDWFIRNSSLMYWAILGIYARRSCAALVQSRSMA